MDINHILKNHSSAIHFIGIGGVSMSSLAKLLKADGHTVTGSDMKVSENTENLEKAGINVKIGHKKENVPNCDLVIYTAAVKENNPEIIEAKEKGIFLAERCDLLGALMKKYKFPINIAGTHGKTTTTSMMAGVFVDLLKNPTISIGGDYNKIGGNLRIGDKNYFICEACEYVESFLKFYPYVSVILNIEEDHLDYFKDINHIKSAFLKFAKRTDENGFVILNYDDKNCMEIKKDIPVKTYTFGLSENADCYADNIEYIKGKPSFDVYINNKLMGRTSLSVYGKHNILNSLSVCLTAYLFNLDMSLVLESLKDFTGAHRRFEYKGNFNGAEIFDDYAHHPTEIATAINSAKSRDYNKLYIVFQPHTYSRTEALLPEFIKVFDIEEEVIFADIFAAREKNTKNITSRIISDNLKNATYIGDLFEIEKYLRKNLKENDLLITIGAGDVYKIGEALVNNKN